MLPLLTFVLRPVCIVPPSVAPFPVPNIVSPNINAINTINLQKSILPPVVLPQAGSNGARKR